MCKMTSLEALEKIEKDLVDLGYDEDEYGRPVSCGYVYMHQLYPEEFELIRSELKALEIINNKRIDVDWFKECNSYTAYNKSQLIYSKINQDEYELVSKALNKEILKNE